MIQALKTVSIFFISLILISLQSTDAQIASGGEPYSLKYKSQYNFEHISLKASYIPRPEKKQDRIRSGAFKFAEAIDVNVSNTLNGTWEYLPSGDKLWTIGIKSEGAYSLNLTFNKFIIPNGATVFVYNPDKTDIKGAFTSENHKKSHKLAVSAIRGDELIIEYYEPANAEFEGILEISTVGHDFMNVFGLKDGQFGVSEACNIDINCTDGVDWQKEKRAICRMLVNNEFFCTGTLINNTQNDETPYILSANHCIDKQAWAENTVFYFNYESPSCEGIDGQVWQTISGAELISTKNENEEGFLDFTLVKLSTKVPANYFPYFAGWDSRDQVPQKTVTIHHPNGDVKKITKDNNPPIVGDFSSYGFDTLSFWKVEKWDSGTTEQGSSGCPLFDMNHRIIGTLTGGQATCSNPINDLFQMLSFSYDKYSADSLQLKKWLDPNNSGVQFIDGYNPLPDTNYTDLLGLYHWDPEEDKAIFTTDGGYVSGKNDFGDLAKAEYFDESEIGNRNFVISGYVFFFLAKGSDDTNIEFFIMDDSDGEPGNIIGTQMVSLKDIKEDVDSLIPTEFDFDPPIMINSSIYFGVNIPQTAGDSIAILNTDAEPEVNYAWEKNASGNWIPYSSEDSWTGNWINIMALKIGLKTDVDEKKTITGELRLFPNPTNSELNIEWSDKSNCQSVYVYNNLGQVVSSSNAFTNSQSMVIDVKNWKNGFYIVRVKTTSGFITSKFIKQ